MATYMLLAGLAGFIVILIAMNNDLMRTKRGLELNVDQLEEQNARLLKRIDQYRKGQETLEKDYAGAVAALKVCEVKLSER